MRETRNAQGNIFDFYSEHERGRQLKELSDVLDQHAGVVRLVEQDFHRHDVASTGARGLSLESIFRCLVLKLMLGASYRELEFVLSDSPTYRRFAQLRGAQSPSRSALQATVRRVSPETLRRINQLLVSGWVEGGELSLDTLRIDSTVVDSNIAPPRDSQLLDDGVRVLSRLMSNSKMRTGVKIRFVDQRKRSKSLAFRIFHAKRAEKDALYPHLLGCVAITLRQTDKALNKVRSDATARAEAQRWVQEVEHYRALLLRIIDQTQRRLFNDDTVPASQKIVSLFEPHTDIIVKGKRDVQYGHMVNLATQDNGFVTYLDIEDGNPSDAMLYMPVLEACQNDYGKLPFAVVAAGVEGNISELKRAFGMARANWKGHEGFKAYVWSAVVSYNLIRMARFSSA